MARRSIALGNRQQTGQAGFGSEQVITATIECIVVHGIADRQQLAFRHEQEGEIHSQCHRSSVGSNLSEARQELVTGVSLGGLFLIVVMLGGRLAQHPYPEQHFFGPAFLGAAQGIMGDSRGVIRELSQCGQARDERRLCLQISFDVLQAEAERCDQCCMCRRDCLEGVA